MLPVLILDFCLWDSSGCPAILLEILLKKTTKARGCSKMTQAGLRQGAGRVRLARGRAGPIPEGRPGPRVTVSTVTGLPWAARDRR